MVQSTAHHGHSSLGDLECFLFSVNEAPEQSSYNVNDECEGKFSFAPVAFGYAQTSERQWHVWVYIAQISSPACGEGARLRQCGKGEQSNTDFPRFNKCGKINIIMKTLSQEDKHAGRH